MKNKLVKKTIKNIQDLINSIEVKKNDAGKIVISGDGEDFIAWLLKLEKKVKEAKEKVANEILKKAEEQMGGFSGFQGKYIKAYKREYYKLEDENKAKSFIKEVVRVYKNVDKQKVEEYLKNAGKLPEGIKKEKKLVVSLKNNE